MVFVECLFYLFFGKIKNCGVLTSFLVSFLAVEVESSSCFLKLSMMMFAVPLCFLAGSSFSFFMKVLVFKLLIQFVYTFFCIHNNSSSTFVSFSYNNILSFCTIIYCSFITLSIVALSAIIY